MTLTIAPTMGDKIPTALEFETIRALPVQHEGRFPPLDTLARDIVQSVTGVTDFEGYDPVLLLLAWTFDPDEWTDEPLITLSNAELRRELGLPASQTVFSYNELVAHNSLREMMDNLRRAGRRKLDPLEAKVSDIHSRLLTLQSAFRNEIIRVIPHPTDHAAEWFTIPAAAEGGAVSVAWHALESAFLSNNRTTFNAASEQLRAAQEAAHAAYYPSQSKIDNELRYNRLRPFRTAWIVMIGAAVLAGFAMFVRRRWFDVLAVVGMLAGFGLLTYGLSMRWEIAGRIPASNMFESLLFLSWGMGVFAILAMWFSRERSIPLTASAMGALALCLGDVLIRDQFVRPTPPVLMDTMWMSIHVPIIMVSYSVLALGVLFAHLQVVTMALVPGRRRLVDWIDATHYWYIHAGSLLLLIGIITGSMWAASSWGRYWGWDPKEVWSLVAFLGYLAILHVKIDREYIPKWAYVVGGLISLGVFVLVALQMEPITRVKAGALVATAIAVAFFLFARGRFSTAVKSIVAFWMIVMTYLGVNYVLASGLHSYGFGTGAVAKRMLTVGAIDLAVILVCGVIYLLRRESAVEGRPA
jgi:ABC-type transport system involved in cytochrome c biogenesis permease subunit